MGHPLSPRLDVPRNTMTGTVSPSSKSRGNIASQPAPSSGSSTQKTTGQRDLTTAYLPITPRIADTGGDYLVFSRWYDVLIKPSAARSPPVLSSYLDGADQSQFWNGDPP